MNKKSSEQWNNAINNPDLSKQIKMENEQSYGVRNRDNTTIPYHSELQTRKHSDYQADTAESMDRKKSNNILQGHNHRID